MRSLCLLLVWVALSSGRLVLQKGAFLLLPDGADRLTFNAGTADKAAYDYQENLLYVIGHTADVVHVINMTNPQNPVRLSTRAFNKINQGLPNDVKVCRRPNGDGYLAVSFESASQTEKGHVHFYDLLTNDVGVEDSLLYRRLDVVTTESYDPRPIAWRSDCNELVVASEGDPHQFNGYFEDPPADLEVLIPGFGTTVNRREIPISATKAQTARARQVFNQCDSGTAANLTSTLLQDLEPKAVHVDQDDVAYIIFQENNAIASLDLKDPFAEMQFFSLGTKDWSHLTFDGSYDDNGINLRSRHIRSFYQPGDMVSFELDDKMWLATADTGSVRRYSLSTCRFDESVAASGWRQPFSDGLTPPQVTQLQGEMASTAQLGRLIVSKLRTATDGWDTVYQGYDFVTAFGGRGFSILDPVTMQRVYDSGDEFERYFTTANATEADKAVYNGDVGNANQAQSAQFDRRSIELGPEPSAIAVGPGFDNDTQVLIIANGRVGGLYTYLVTSGPTVTFESYVRRGQPGMTWNAAYQQANSDAVGEPFITDLLFIDDQGQKTVVAVSRGAGALSFYSLSQA